MLCSAPLSPGHSPCLQQHMTGYGRIRRLGLRTTALISLARYVSATRSELLGAKKERLSPRLAPIAQEY